MPVRPTKESGLTTVACVECRKQHLKCDAKRPSCSRCLQNGLHCEYVASRRGGRRISRHKQRLAASSSTSPVYQQSLPGMSPHQMQPVLQSVTPSVSGHANRHVPTPPSTSFSQQLTSSHVSNAASDEASWLGMLPANDYASGVSLSKSSTEDDNRLLRLYYENFHAAHPILVPSGLYTIQNYPPYLQAVVHFVGSQYTSSGRLNEYKNRVVNLLASHTRNSPAAVQSWLIYAIVLNARMETDEAQAALTTAIDLALELGMNRAGFASSSYPERSFEAESLRRTWWELYITEIHMAISLDSCSSRCCASHPEVALPCEESIYNGLRDIPRPSTMLDFRRRILAAEDPIFSSFSYRIEATMVLSRVTMLNRITDCHRDHVQAAENALVSWTNHLPATKLDIIDAYGNVDEMMFQAHITIGYAAMLLHLPRSDLHPVLAQPEKSQFRLGTSCHQQLSSTSTRLVHSIKATEASRQVSDSISICPNILKHSPFILPALSLCGLIQLATSTVHSDECFDHHCNRVNLILGCLKSARRTWELAESTYQSLRSSAAELMSASLERCQWNAAPVNQQPAPSESTTADATRPSSVALDGQDPMMTCLPPNFFDRACFNASIFTAVPDLDMI